MRTKEEVRQECRTCKKTARLLLPLLLFLLGADNRPPKKVPAKSQAPKTQAVESPAPALKSSVEVRGVTDFDPSESDGFLVSFAVEFHGFPAPGERVNLVSKFDQEAHPYAGWAIGFRQFETSLRPAVYWRDRKGRGGWQSFESVSLQPDTPYCVSLVAKAKEFASLFYEQRQTGAEQFLGGLTLDELGLPRSNAPLLLGEARGAKYRFKGKIQDVLIARLKKIPHTQEDAAALVRGCSPEIEQRLTKEEIVLKLPGLETEDPRQEQRARLSENRPERKKARRVAAP